MSKKNTILPYLSLFLAMFLWASSFVALKIAFKHYHPMVVIFFRMLVGSFCFIVVARLFNKVTVRKKDIKLILMMVVCEPCLYFIFEAKALALTSASQAGMITALMPLMVSFVAVFALNERMSRTTAAGLVISVFGACWLSFSGKASVNAPNPPLGNFYELIAMICAAGYTISLKKLTQKGYSALFLTALQAFAGSIFFFPMLFFPSTALPSSFEPVSVLAIVYLGTAVTLGAYGCFNFGVSRMPAGQAASFINLIPVIALILGIIILKESLTLQQYAACSVVFAGIYLSQQRERKVCLSSKDR